MHANVGDRIVIKAHRIGGPFGPFLIATVVSWPCGSSRGQRTERWPRPCRGRKLRFDALRGQRVSDGELRPRRPVEVQSIAASVADAVRRVASRRGPRRPPRQRVTS